MTAPVIKFTLELTKPGGYTPVTLPGELTATTVTHGALATIVLQL